MPAQIVPPIQSNPNQQYPIPTDHTELSFPFSLDGYSHNSSTSDTMKSLLNAIMQTVPPLSESLQISSANLPNPLDNPFLQQHQQLYTSAMAGQPMEPVFSSNSTTAFNLMPPQDDSSLGMIIAQHAHAMDGASLSDSLACAFVNIF